MPILHNRGLAEETYRGEVTNAGVNLKILEFSDFACEKIAESKDWYFRESAICPDFGTIKRC